MSKKPLSEREQLAIALQEAEIFLLRLNENIAFLANRNDDAAKKLIAVLNGNVDHLLNVQIPSLKESLANLS